MTRVVYLGDWRPIVAAIEAAYTEFGYTREITPDGSKIQDDHWNVGLRMYQAGYAAANEGKCLICQAVLNYHTVIRCLDCRSTLCERCAPGHFGPNHTQRAMQAHPET